MLAAFVLNWLVLAIYPVAMWTAALHLLEVGLHICSGVYLCVSVAVVKAAEE